MLRHWLFGFLTLFFSLMVRAHPVQRTEPATYQFAADDLSSKITLAQAQDLISLFQKVMQPDFTTQFQNQSWQVDFDWNQSYLGAGSTYHDGGFHIMLWGGWVRATFMTPGALAATLCHEAGHRLAGVPLQHFPDQEPWSSAEGQADHFAATVCLPRMYDALVATKSPLLERSLEPEAQVLCRNSSHPQKCQWVATSGIDLIQFVQVYYERDLPFAQPEMVAPERPAATLATAYPSYQCRMNTFTQGAACDRGLLCPRPACWFVQ